MQPTIRYFLGMVFAALVAQPVHAQLYGHDGGIFVKTVAPLDDPRGFCIDLPGHPEEVRPAWLHRDITVEPCNWRIGERQQWQLATPEMPVPEE